MQGLDIALVSDWIAGLDAGIKGPFRASPLGDGKSNLTYLLEDAEGRRWVLRRPPLGTLLASAHDIAREHRILASLSSAQLPVPRPVALRVPDRRIDVPLLLMEHVPGCVVDSDDALAAVAPERRRAIGLSLATTLARIHEVDLAATQLDDPASHKPYAARQLKRWSRQFEDSRIRELPLVTQLAERLRGSMPDQHELTLVHGDYHLLNVITDQQHGGVRAVVDWELATLGDPLADLGGLLAYWPQSDDSLPPAPTPFPAAPGFPSRAELVGAYADASGRCTKAIGFWETLGCWKVAIISEGVLRRAIDRGSDLEASRSARVTEVMLQRAELAANRAGI